MVSMGSCLNPVVELSWVEGKGESFFHFYLRGRSENFTELFAFISSLKLLKFSVSSSF